MKASEFKIEIKKIQELLRGLTIQFVTKNSVKPLKSLREFGLQVLEQEKYGNDFSMAWSNDGTVTVNSIEQVGCTITNKYNKLCSIESLN